MARGRRSGRTGASGGSARADGPALPESIETVEYEELPEGPSSQAQGSVGAAGAGDDTGRIDRMAEPDEVREPVTPTAADPASSPPARKGGFLPGLIGGLLGGAAIVGGGGWWAYEKGPIKPALERLETTQAATQSAESGIATLGGKLDELGSSVGGKLAALDTSVGGLGNELGTTKTALQQADATIAALNEKLAATESALGEKLAAAEAGTVALAAKLEQADRAFRAAGDQVTARMEAVNAKLVEVEQGQPADVVDKKTVADIAAKQAGIEQGQQSVEAALARLEQLVTQSLEAGNKQATALQTMVEGAGSRMEDIATQQRELLAMKTALDEQAKVNEEQAATLADAAAQLQAIRAELQDKVQGARDELQQQLVDTSSRLTTEGAARERSVGLSLATNSLDASLQTGQPFTPTIDILRQLGQDDQVVQGVAATLEPMAAGGIPTTGSLAQQLAEIQQSLAPASTSEPTDWLERTRENLNSLVNLHPVDEEAVPGESAVLAAREALLLQNLPGAVAAMQPLAEQGNAAAQAWVASANQRLSAAEAVESLRQHLKTMLARQG